MNIVDIAVLLLIWAAIGSALLFALTCPHHGINYSIEGGDIKKHKMGITLFIFGPVAWVIATACLFNICVTKKYRAWLAK